MCFFAFHCVEVENPNHLRLSPWPIRLRLRLTRAVNSEQCDVNLKNNNLLLLMDIHNRTFTYGIKFFLLLSEQSLVSVVVIYV